jgi:hypothetical protein
MRGGEAACGGIDTPATTLPERLGLAMRAHPRVIVGLQVFTVVFYLVLLVLPAINPLPDDDAGILDNLTRFAQFVFWGLWWPGVILTVLLLGRLWCGVLCPEGALSEWASHIGAGRGIPRWMKWSVWPLVAFLATTVYGQLISVYEYPQAALLILGGSTVAAVLVGLMYGRGKRVWCRHLCPVNGVFGILARFSALHFRVDRATWDAAPAGERSNRRIQVNCAPLIDIRRMDSMAACHACGRCSGQRHAVALRWRAPGSELLGDGRGHELSRVEMLLLLYGMLGVALGAFQWSGSPWFVAIKQTVAMWLANADIWWPFATNAPWWLLTHHEGANDVFSWLDGALIVTYIGVIGVVVGGTLHLLCHAAARCLGTDWSAQRLAGVYTPMAATSLVIGLTMTSFSLLAAEGLPLGWLDGARLLALAAGSLWSALLIVRLMQQASGRQRHIAALLLMAGTLPVGLLWCIQWFAW